MRATLAALALLVVGVACAGPRPAWELRPPAPRDAPVTRPDALRRDALENGLRVLLLEDRRLPRITLGITLRRGAAIVPPERAGLAAFTANLMERGAGDRDALALARAVEEIGARLSVFADWDSMGVRVSGLARDLERLLEILADVTLRPRFEEAEAARVRGETLASPERAFDDPATLSAWHTARVLYTGHRYGLPRSGSPDTVETLDAERARGFHAQVFVPSNAIFSATGDFDPDQLLASSRALFGAWQGEAPPADGPLPLTPTPVARRVRIVDRPDLEQARISLGHEGISRTDDQRIAAQLLNAALGGSGFSSRLMQRLRAESGLTYGVWSGFSLRRAAGPFQASTFTRVGETRRVIDLLLAELEGMRTRPPDEQELRNAQMLAVGEFALGLETSAAVTAALVDLDVYGLPEDALDTYRARVRAVTTEDVARSSQLLHPERAAIVLVGPAELLRPQVEDLGPVEVIQP